MANTLKEFLKSIADQLRANAGTDAKIKPNDFVNEIANTVGENVSKLDTTVYLTSANDTIIQAGQYIEGNQTILGVKVSGVTAEDIRLGKTLTVGDANKSDRVVKIVGTASAPNRSVYHKYETVVGSAQVNAFHPVTSIPVIMDNNNYVYRMGIKFAGGDSRFKGTFILSILDSITPGTFIHYNFESGFEQTWYFFPRYKSGKTYETLGLATIKNGVATMYEISVPNEGPIGIELSITNSESVVQFGQDATIEFNVEDVTDLWN